MSVNVNFIATCNNPTAKQIAIYFADAKSIVLCDICASYVGKLQAYAVIKVGVKLVDQNAAII